MTFIETTPPPTAAANGHRWATILAAAAAAVIVAGAVVLAGCDGDTNDPITGQPPSATDVALDPAHPTAVEVARGFVDAYGAFDADRAITYLADDVYLSALTEARLDPAELPLVLAWLEAVGHEQMLDTCEEQRTSAADTRVRCTYAFHSFGSRELGLGPFNGSYFDLTVRDGEIVRASEHTNISDFSPQLWEPFSYSWMVANHPADIDVMYRPDRNGARFTEESNRLWEQHLREYVASHADRP